MYNLKMRDDVETSKHKDRCADYVVLLTEHSGLFQFSPAAARPGLPWLYGS